MPELWSDDKSNLEQLGLSELIDHSSLGTPAAKAFIKQDPDDGHTENVLALLEQLDAEEEAEQPASNGLLASPPTHPSIMNGFAALCKKHELRAGQRLGTDQRMLDLCARAIAGAQRTHLIEALFSELIETVSRSTKIIFRSRRKISTFFLHAEAMPPPSVSPVLGVPGGDILKYNDCYRLDDDTALVLDKVRFEEGTPSRRRRDWTVTHGRHEVFWPARISSATEEFYLAMLNSIYRVDLAPHTLLTPLTLAEPDPLPGVIGLVWRVVDPLKVVENHPRAPFSTLLEAVVDGWRSALLEDIRIRRGISDELRRDIVQDPCWSNLGLEVSIQLCAQHDGETVESLSNESFMFLANAFRDPRRWFPPPSKSSDLPPQRSSTFHADTGTCPTPPRRRRDALETTGPISGLPGGN